MIQFDKVASHTTAVKRILAKDTMRNAKTVKFFLKIAMLKVSTRVENTSIESEAVIDAEVRDCDCMSFIEDRGSNL